MVLVRGAGAGGEKTVKPLRLQGHSNLSSNHPDDPYVIFWTLELTYTHTDS